MGPAIAAIVAALFAAIATAYAAVQSRRANSATVDVRILGLLQEDVIQLQTRVKELRRELHESQDETDAERRMRRRVEQEMVAMQDLANRMARALVAAGIHIPEATALTTPVPGQASGPSG